MTKRVYSSLLVLALLLPSCGAIIQQQELPGSADVADQQSFDVDYMGLTLPLARQLNQSPFQRQVGRAGSGVRADVIPEAEVMQVRPLPTTAPIPYHIGVGDRVELIIFATKRGITDSAQDVAIARSSRVSQDGTVLFIETGQINVEGLTLAEARKEVADALIRNGIDPRFQFEISDFASQKVSMTVISVPRTQDANQNTGSSVEKSGGSGIYTVTERPMSLRELLVTAKIDLVQDGVQVASVIRNRHRYSIPVQHIMASKSPDYYLTGGDMVELETFPYRKGKALLLTGDGVAGAIEVTPSERPKLSDLLFANDGPLFSGSASNTKQIYLLRGAEAMKAYHLDAQDPSRLRVAAELELRPDDIVFVSAKPLYSLNEMLREINPLGAIIASNR